MNMTGVEGATTDVVDVAVVDTKQNLPAQPLQSPEEVLDRGTRIANLIKPVIDKQGWASKIGQGEHLRVEGWLTIAEMFGCGVDQESCTEHEDGSFTVKVAVLNSQGLKVGGGAGMCGRKDDGHWHKKPAFQRQSMADTRATVKALSKKFRWVVELAGYNPTPYEEMGDDKPVKAKEEIFDMGSVEQCQKLGDVLKHLKVPQKEWQRVETIMNGKPFTKETIKKAVGVISQNG